MANDDSNKMRRLRRRQPMLFMCQRWQRIFSHRNCRSSPLDVAHYGVHVEGGRMHAEKHVHVKNRYHLVSSNMMEHTRGTRGEIKRRIETTVNKHEFWHRLFVRQATAGSLLSCTPSQLVEATLAHTYNIRTHTDTKTHPQYPINDDDCRVLTE